MKDKHEKSVNGAGHGQKLTQRQEALIAALLSQETMSEAAAVAGVAEVTVYRWLKLDTFNTAYRAARAETVRQAIAQVQQNTGKAARVLLEIAENRKAPPSARVSAARAILETALKAVEIDELTERVEQLENLIEKGTPHELKRTG